MEFTELNAFIDFEDQYLHNLYGGYPDEEKRVLARTVKLTEEIGELCNEVLMYNALQRKQKLESHDKDNLPAEFADVLLATLLLAKAMHVDIEQALTQKIATIRARQQ